MMSLKPSMMPKYPGPSRGSTYLIAAIIPLILALFLALLLALSKGANMSLVERLEELEKRVATLEERRWVKE